MGARPRVMVTKRHAEPPLLPVNFWQLIERLRQIYMWPMIFKLIGGSLLAFAVVWALILGWWQSNDFEPSKLDLALYLGALPLALVGGYLLLRGFIEHLKAPAVSDKPGLPVLKDDDPLAAASSKTAEAERAFRICLLDSFVVTAAGATTDEIFSSIEDGKRPEPSFRLTDESGFPVFLAEVKDLETDGVLDSISEMAPSLSEFAASEEITRSLALVDGLLGPVREFLSPLLLRESDRPNLRIVWLIPSHWDSSQLAVLRTWFLLNYWAGFDMDEKDVSMVPVADEADVMHQFDEINLRSNRENKNKELTLLLAAISSVDESSVGQRATKHHLFSAIYQDKPIPGEGGVAMLLASPATAGGLVESEVVALSRVSRGRRDKSVEAGGRIDGRLIGQLVSGVLDVTSVKSEQIKTVLLDADHRASRVTEAMEGVGDIFGHLDPAKDWLTVGAVIGDVAPFGGLLALATAATKALSSEAPVLCLCNQHQHERGALIASPFVTSLNYESSTT